MQAHLPGKGLSAFEGKVLAAAQVGVIALSIEAQTIANDDLESSAILWSTTLTDDIASPHLDGVIDDVNLFIPVRIELNTTLLLTNAYVVFRRIEAVPRKISVHIYSLNSLSKYRPTSRREGTHEEPMSENASYRFAGHH
jgi:hypothetical protein